MIKFRAIQAEEKMQWEHACDPNSDGEDSSIINEQLMLVSFGNELRNHFVCPA